MDIISYKLNNLDINSDKIEICILPLILFEPTYIFYLSYRYFCYLS